MRCFEILILSGLLLILVLLFRKNRIRKTLILASAFLFLISVAHFIFEGSRWQMVPAYFGILILLLSSLLAAVLPNTNKHSGRDRARYRKVLRATGFIFSCLLILLMAVPPALLPVFQLPGPTGPNKVGSSIFYCVDSSRIDLHSEAFKYREISCRVWYPADPSAKEKSIPYMQPLEARSLAGLYNMPPFLLNHFRYVKTESFLNENPKDGSYPLILYCPSGDMLQNTALFQELVSHGYIVLSVGHPYWNAFYYDNTGQIVPFSNDNSYYQSMWEEEYSDSVIAIKERITTAVNLDQKRMEQLKLNQYMPLEIGDIKLWVEDLSFLLDELENSTGTGKQWIEHVDLEHVGVMGFSKGGAAAGQFCISEKRCRAGVNLSGFMFGDVAEKSIEVPFMFLENLEDWCVECQPICEVPFMDAMAESYMVRIKGARHGNFSDWSKVGPYLKIMGMIGPINGNRCLEIQAHYVRSFFDCYLKEKDPVTLQDLSKSYPEVTFESRL